MKILLYSISSAHEMTGIGKYNGELLNWFWKKGYQADMMTSLPYYPFWEIYDGYKDDKYKIESFEKGKIYSVRLPVSKNVSSIRRVWMDLSLMLKTCFWLPYLSFKNKYDIIILVLPPLSIFLVAIFSKYFGDSKLHVHIQDLQIEAARELKLLPAPLLSMLEAVEKTCFRFADFITTISDNMVKQVKKKNSNPDKKIEVIENWADTEGIRPIEEKSWLKERFGYNENVFLVVYSGNIGEKQGVDQILPVAKALGKYGNIQVLVLGDGANKSNLLAKSKGLQLSNIQFGNLVPKDKLNMMLNGSDIQLILQRKEATDSFLPSKYINILSAGIPSVITAKEGTELFKIASDNNTSLIADPENIQMLSEAILKLYKNKELRKSLSENSRRFALKKFGKDYILERLMGYYREIL